MLSIRNGYPSQLLVDKFPMISFVFPPQHTQSPYLSQPCEMEHFSQHFHKEPCCFWVSGEPRVRADTGEIINVIFCQLQCPSQMFAASARFALLLFLQELFRPGSQWDLVCLVLPGVTGRDPRRAIDPQAFKHCIYAQSEETAGVLGALQVMSAAVFVKSTPVRRQLSTKPQQQQAIGSCGGNFSP